MALTDFFPSFQTSCNFGRESFDSWGRRKRRAVSDDDDTMRLSREIIVLDYGDEQTSPYDFDRGSRPRGGNCESHFTSEYMYTLRFKCSRYRMKQL